MKRQYVGRDFSPELLSEFRRRAIPAAADQCWLWPVGARIYGAFYALGTQSLVHRISFAAHHHDPGDLVVRHRCDTPACWNPRCLELGTYLDNIQDAVDRDRVCHSDARATRLTSDDAREIFRAYHSGGAWAAELARDFGIDEREVHRIARRALWRRATADLPGSDITFRQVRGARQGSAKATDEVVDAIRRRVAAGEPRKAMVAEYGLSTTQVRRIVRGESWAWRL